MPMPPMQPIEIASPILSATPRSPVAISQKAPTKPAYWIGRKR